MFKEFVEYQKKKNSIELLESVIQDKIASSKEELDSINLMDRKDDKYIIAMDKLHSFISALPSDYLILQIDECRIFTYNNIYFDTPDLLLYHQHHNKKLNRFKVRIRSYSETQITSLEIKSKNNKKVTSKKKMEIPFHLQELGSKEIDFLEKNICGIKTNFEEQVRIIYKRMTFFNSKTNEKITIDFSMKFGDNTYLPNLVIIEHKYSKRTKHTLIRALLKSKEASKIKLSKYCFALFLTKENLKANRFKKNYLKILKIINHWSYYGFVSKIGTDLQFSYHRLYN